MPSLCEFKTYLRIILNMHNYDTFLTLVADVKNKLAKVIDLSSYLSSIEKIIDESNGITRSLAQAINYAAPNVLDVAKYPINSFTSSASRTNLNVTLNSLRNYRYQLSGEVIATLLDFLNEFDKVLDNQRSEYAAMLSEQEELRASVREYGSLIANLLTSETPKDRLAEMHVVLDAVDSQGEQHTPDNLVVAINTQWTHSIIAKSGNFNHVWNLSEDLNKIMRTAIYHLNCFKNEDRKLMDFPDTVGYLDSIKLYAANNGFVSDSTDGSEVCEYIQNLNSEICDSVIKESDSSLFNLLSVSDINKSLPCTLADVDKFIAELKAVRESLMENFNDTSRSAHFTSTEFSIACKIVTNECLLVIGVLESVTLYEATVRTYWQVENELACVRYRELRNALRIVVSGE